MPSRIDFRNCVHQAVAGPSPDHILASIRAEYCLPHAPLPAPQPGTPRKDAVVRLEDFTALARALGPEAFRQVTTDMLRQRDPGATLARLPDFLGRHRYGRATPALIDLARLDRAIAHAQYAPAQQSIGACCLPPALLRAHPDLTLAFHPAWQWLDLAYPVDRWRAILLQRDGAADAPAPQPVRLRVQAQQDSIALHRVAPDAFAFELALQQGETLSQADARARLGAASGPAAFDSIHHLQALVMAGAVTGVSLHPSSTAKR